MLSFLATITNIVDTPNFVSSYRLQPVVNDSDLLSGRDFETVDTPASPHQLTARENDMPLKITTSAEMTIRP